MSQKKVRMNGALRCTVSLLLACLILFTMLPLTASAQNTTLYTTSSGLTIRKDGSIYDTDGTVVLSGDGVLDPAKISPRLLDSIDDRSVEPTGKAGVETIYRWHLINSQADLEKWCPKTDTAYPCLLGWWNGSDYYYLTRKDYYRKEGWWNDSTQKYVMYSQSHYGQTENWDGWYKDYLCNNRYQHEYDWMSFGSEIFDTRNHCGSILCQRTYKDSNGINYIKFRWDLNGGGDVWVDRARQYGNCAFFTVWLTGSGYSWRAIFDEQVGSDGDKYYADAIGGEKAGDANTCIFYEERDAKYDSGLEHDGSWFGVDTSSSYDYDEFYLYVGEEYPLTAIDSNVTIEPGKVMNVKDHYIIEEDCTLTVAPGAVLSIEGRFYNNGTIENYGTILIQNAGSISTLEPELSKASEAGKIICHGPEESVYVKEPDKTFSGGEGALLILSGGHLIGNKQTDTLTLNKGATLENFGYMVLPHGLVANNSRIYNRATGRILMGYYFSSGQGTATEDKITGGSPSLLDVPGKLTAHSKGSRNGVKNNCLIKNEGMVRASFNSVDSDALNNVNQWGGSSRCSITSK